MCAPSVCAPAQATPPVNWTTGTQEDAPAGAATTGGRGLHGVRPTTLARMMVIRGVKAIFDAELARKGRLLRGRVIVIDAASD